MQYLITVTARLALVSAVLVSAQGFSQDNARTVDRGALEPYTRTIDGKTDPQLIDNDTAIATIAAAFAGYSKFGPGYIENVMTNVVGMEDVDDQTAAAFLDALNEITKQRYLAQAAVQSSVCSDRSLTRGSVAQLDDAISAREAANTRRTGQFARQRISDAVGAENLIRLLVWIEDEYKRNARINELDVSAYQQDQGIDAATLIGRLCNPVR